MISLNVRVFANFFWLISENEGIEYNLWTSDEAHFHLSGYAINKQNFRNWRNINPSATSSFVEGYRLVCHFIFRHYRTICFQKQTWTSYDCEFSAVFRNFAHIFLSYPSTMWIMRHCFNKSYNLVLLRDVFSNFLISLNVAIPWRPRSPDLSVYDFFFVGLPQK